MDYMSFLPSTKDCNDCVFMVIDRFSKMVILDSCKKIIIIEAIANLLFEIVWVHFGIQNHHIRSRYHIPKCILFEPIFIVGHQAHQVDFLAPLDLWPYKSH